MRHAIAVLMAWLTLGLGESFSKPDLDSIAQRAIHITCVDAMTGELKSMGSATMLTDNRALTAAHVVEGCEAGGGRLEEDETHIEIYVLKIGDIETDDLALIALEKSCGGCTFELAPERPHLGDEVLSVGWPGRLPKLFAKGVTAGQIGPYDAYDMQVTFGDSGSGVYDTQGRLIGVVSRLMYSGVFGDTYRLMGAINVDVIKAFLTGADLVQ